MESCFTAIGEVRENMSKKQKAVVLGRNYASLLGMVRASGKAGCQVTVIRTVRRIPETGTLKVKIKGTKDASES